MKRLLIIDGNNLLYRAHFSHRGLQNTGESVSCLYGVIQILSSIIKRFKPENVIYVWDGKKNKRRLEILPEYKAKRVKVGEDFDQIMEQKPLVKELLACLGIPQVHDITMEADDYIYLLTRRFSREFDETLIVSTDKDFHQLISKKVKIWDDKKKQLIHRSNCKKIFGYKPRQCVDYLILDGDSSDNIKGYPGMGPKTIAKFFSEFNSLAEYLESGKKFGRLDSKKLNEVIEINRELIDLKYFYEANIKGTRIAINYKDLANKPPLKINKFLRLCDSYNIKSFQRKSFIEVFKKQYKR